MDELIIPEINSRDTNSSETDNREEYKTEPLCITYNDEPSSRGKSDDTLLTQCILVLVLAAVIVILRFTKPDFAEGLLQEYEKRISAPPEEFIERLLMKVTEWFKG